MKRVISLALCLLLLLSLAACGKEEPFPTVVTQPTAAPTEPPTEPSTEPETEPPTEPDPDAPYLERAQALLAAGADSVFALAFAAVEFHALPEGTVPIREEEDDEEIF